LDQWHLRLGHPASPIINQVVQSNTLPVSPSKSSSAFPLATKYEVCATFIRFKQLVETFFNTKIKSVQSDNGGESRPLQSALTSMGVSY
jgi:hypothetical protein